jgi:hypothetical protein
MKKGRPSKRSIAARKSRGNHATRKPTIEAGQLFDHLRVLLADTGERKCGKRVALVKDESTGEQKKVIASDLKSGNTKSAGWLKKAKFRAHKERVEAMRETNFDNIDREVIRSAMRQSDSDVDAATGKKIGELRAMSLPEMKRRWLVDHSSILHAIADHWRNVTEREALPNGFDYQAYYEQFMKSDPKWKSIIESPHASGRVKR